MSVEAGPCIDWGKQFSFEELAATPFVPVSSKILKHSVERRGFRTVPFDYDRPRGPKLKVFWRLLPARDGSTTNPNFPILVLINGGPGFPTAIYRPVDFDYSKPSNPDEDRLHYLTQSFRILMIDQRGTSAPPDVTGYSAPLDFTNPKINPAIVNRYFDADEQALDIARVIDEVVPRNEFYFTNGQSYGGLVNYRMLVDPRIKRKPRGAIFSSAAMPYHNPLPLMESRRAQQLKLNRQLQKAVPGIMEKLAKLRDYLASLKLNPNYVHYLWKFLGKGKKGEWEIEFEKEVDSLLKKSKPKLVIYFAKEAGGVNLLNYILSSSALQPGYTDRTINAKIRQTVRFQPWMIDETWTLDQIGEEGSWQQKMADAIDANPPPRLYFPGRRKLIHSLSQVDHLYTFGLGDALLPMEFSKPHAETLAVPKRTEMRVIPGGHRAIFNDAGYQAAIDWAFRLLARDLRSLKR